eukprot:TRINITY_DN17529_c0_g1_i1.p2 TRINITY_DN17529_c0_g1~~TRINITY_DN17529_c0_g1_i1.p2  ORF type:complete len:254 (+),score=-17.38 TRINITY_DN17529_c0_g1_i1:762-1523(+)
MKRYNLSYYTNTNIYRINIFNQGCADFDIVDISLPSYELFGKYSSNQIKNTKQEYQQWLLTYSFFRSDIFFISTSQKQPDTTVRIQRIQQAFRFNTQIDNMQDVDLKKVDLKLNISCINRCDISTSLISTPPIYYQDSNIFSNQHYKICVQEHLTLKIYSNVRQTSTRLTLQKEQKQLPCRGQVIKVLSYARKFPKFPFYRQIWALENRLILVTKKMWVYTNRIELKLFIKQIFVSYFFVPQLQRKLLQEYIF